VTCLFDNVILTHGSEYSQLNEFPLSQVVRFQSEVILVFDPNQFRVNEAWVAFKLNDARIVTVVDGDHNVIALMDAASCMILGTEFIRADSSEPSQLESRRLLKGGQSHKQQFPKKLFIPINQVADILSIEAQKNNILIVRVPEDQLSLFIGEAREGFRQHVSGCRIQ